VTKEAHLLGELLAVLNGDGGHCAAEHGVEAAFKRGLERHYATLAASEREIARLRELLGREKPVKCASCGEIREGAVETNCGNCGEVLT
jgi:hypothetical protein